MMSFQTLLQKNYPREQYNQYLIEARACTTKENFQSDQKVISRQVKLASLGSLWVVCMHRNNDINCMRKMQALYYII